MEEKLAAVFSEFKGSGEELIPILQKVQDAFGCLPEDSMLRIARFTGLPESQVYAVATFYAQFRFTPIGKNHVMVCRGTACHVQGGPRILQMIENQLGIREGDTTPDGAFTLETVACIGACGLAPSMVINKNTYGHLTTKKVSEILAGLRTAGVEDPDEPG